MKLYIDDVRPAPTGYIHCKSVNAAIEMIKIYHNWLDFDNNIVNYIELIDIDHDSGKYNKLGGDYINVLNWMEENGINDIPIHIHSQNVVGVENMRRIIQRNGWTEVF